MNDAISYRIREDGLEDREIRGICETHQLTCNNITKVVGSFEKEVFSVDDRYVIRTSRQSMHEEQIKYDRIRNMKYVPKILHASDQRKRSSDVNYLILEYIKGSELLTSSDDLKEQDLYEIGVALGDFLFELHSIKGESYDIGHYVPIIPGYKQSWRSGHEAYWDSIYQGLNNLDLPKDMQQLLELSNEYIQKNVASLEFEGGPSLLHNDFHLKNIILHDRKLSGVIDWECSQYGEADFDLIHLLHWCLFPPSEDMDWKPLFNAVFLSYRRKNRIPGIGKRLAIYMLEHDFIQILWSKGKRADEFQARIRGWLDGSLEEYIQNLIEC